MTQTQSVPVATVMIFIAGLFLSPPAQSVVAVKNGNYSVSYKDHAYPGGFETKVARDYNSKSGFKGKFGWGWGSEDESYLKDTADGGVIVHEYGGGAENRFAPDRVDPNALDAAISAMVQAARELGKFGNADQLKQYSANLKANAEFRNEEWDRLVTSGKIKRRILPTGTQLKSVRYSFQVLSKTGDGYQRKFDTGKVELFDNDGRLRKVTDRNGNFITLEYKDRKLYKIQDNLNRKLFFTFNSAGLVEKIEGEGGKTSFYKYNARNELIESKDAEGNVYKYAYDTYPGAEPNRHNLSEITYADGTSQKIEYYGKDKFENVRAVTGRDGIKSEYVYEYNLGGDSKRFRVSVSASEKGKLVSKSAYEYENKVRASDGEQWTYKMVTTIGSQKTETIYNECCGLPLSIRQNGQETLFAYNPRGQVTQKTTPFEVTQLTYDPANNKVKRVAKFPKTKSEKPSWAEYGYDSRGNLNLAKNSAGHGVKLVHDAQGHILSMMDHNRKRIDFKYDVNGKPVQICEPAQGCIKVSYSNSGEVKTLDPGAAGRSVAQTVKTAFQNLVEVLEPAGVDLGFF